MKKTAKILAAPQGHWVGDGFPVRGMFGPLAFTPEISPFLMMDYAGPFEFPPTDEKRGVDVHPHKGFETVTIVYQGEVEHRDSAGHHGTIRPGDVQWMTAASGILHEEFHSRAFSRRGGMFEMVQLWVNLPAANKSDPPRYQALLDADIPVVALENGAGLVRIIAGAFRGKQGAATTCTPINLWDVRLKAGAMAEFNVSEGFMTAVFVLHGGLDLDDGSRAGEAGLAILDPGGDSFRLRAREDSTVLVLNGKPIREPIVAQGPFVMNSQQEIREAIMEFQSGKMGHL